MIIGIAWRIQNGKDKGCCWSRKERIKFVRISFKGIIVPYPFYACIRQSHRPVLGFKCCACTPTDFMYSMLHLGPPNFKQSSLCAGVVKSYHIYIIIKSHIFRYKAIPSILQLKEGISGSSKLGSKKDTWHC